ncbi:L domain-like protein [Rhizoclosmatium globosum]|uniref:L domain-like protein n=1 Tax=Rhizoclosmatium globosum TaxID=329046 RepID=A0A1Y2CP13_9FUNG|nr:L domain-like protein [Rhizoclosmatium globosum]|eukprot:ORY48742.1 L domain-like protein [Rhizoclosmatium globosum]
MPIQDLAVILGDSPSSSIHCDVNNSITSLSVIKEGPFPTIQISQFFALTKLQYITLQSLGLVGTIPELPSNLININLKNNNMKGPIPILPSGLISLDISFNQLTGSIPSLPSTLKTLTLWNNQLTGSIPSLVAGMTTLVLTQNQLSGQIPDLPITLRDLELASNNLEGSIPQLPSVMFALNLANNKLTGTIPPLPTFTRGYSGTMGAAMLDGNCFLNATSKHVINNCVTEVTLTSAVVSATGSISPFFRFNTTTVQTPLPQDSGPNVAAIAGGAVGALVLLIVVGVVLWWVQKRPKHEYPHSSAATQYDSESNGANIPPSVIQSDGSTLVGLLTATSGGTTVPLEKGDTGFSLFTAMNQTSNSSSTSFLASITPVGAEKHLFEERNGSCSVSPGSGLPAEATSWTIQNVAYWIYFNHGGEHVARNVIDQKVDGITLMNAEIDDLINILDFEKLGDKVAFKLLLTDMRQTTQAAANWEAPPAY